jgi:hypothetical protein
MQASWVTVRGALRELAPEQNTRVHSEHVLQLARLCPLLLQVRITASMQPCEQPPAHACGCA